MNAFDFTSTTIEPERLRIGLEDPAAGGYASFEGWVRNHNEGHAVTRLEYEAFELLARKEGERIVAEAIQRFDVLQAACVHRVGSLAIGELAVWVGVSARHRAEAFAACRYIIDEVKHRVPIWKKEHYVNGDSGWVNCERCAAHPLPLPVAGDECMDARGRTTQGAVVEVDAAAAGEGQPRTQLFLEILSKDSLLSERFDKHERSTQSAVTRH